MGIMGLDKLFLTSNEDVQSQSLKKLSHITQASACLGETRLPPAVVGRSGLGNLLAASQNNPSDKFENSLKSLKRGKNFWDCLISITPEGVTKIQMLGWSMDRWSGFAGGDWKAGSFLPEAAQLTGTRVRIY